MLRRAYLCWGYLICYQCALPASKTTTAWMMLYLDFAARLAVCIFVFGGSCMLNMGLWQLPALMT
jgi:hypothetical protein